MDLRELSDHALKLVAIELLQQIDYKLEQIHKVLTEPAVTVEQVPLDKIELTGVMAGNWVIELDPMKESLSRFKDRPEVHQIVRSWDDPSRFDATTVVYRGYQVAGAREHG